MLWRKTSLCIKMSIWEKKNLYPCNIIYLFTGNMWNYTFNKQENLGHVTTFKMPKILNWKLCYLTHTKFDLKFEQRLNNLIAFHNFDRRKY